MPMKCEFVNGHVLFLGRHDLDHVEVVRAKFVSGFFLFLPSWVPVGA